jgi:hypothetical protein
MVSVADAKAELQTRMSANPVSGKTPEQAMSDPRYKSDPMFKAEVDRAASIGSAPQSQSSGKTPEEAMSDPRYKSDPIFKAEVDRAASIGSAPKSQSSKGFSMEYLQKAADPNRFGRYLVSVEKAQELLNQARSR